MDQHKQEPLRRASLLPETVPLWLCASTTLIDFRRRATPVMRLQP